MVLQELNYPEIYFYEKHFPTKERVILLQTKQGLTAEFLNSSGNFACYLDFGDNHKKIIQNKSTLIHIEFINLLTCPPF